MKERPTAPQSPWQNPNAERLIGSIRRITSSSSTNAISNGFSVIISPITTNGARTDPWRSIHPMVDLSIHPNWARSSSSQRSMAYTIIIFGKPHEYSGPTVGSARSC
jgi:hypothetical protein